MRIWLLTSELPHEITGGIARYADSFARLAGAAGHEVTLLARSWREADEQPAPGVRVLRVLPRDSLPGGGAPGAKTAAHPAYPYNILSHWPALSYQFAEELLDLAEREGPPDLIESQEYGALPYYLLQRKLSERTVLEHTPIVVHMHSATFDMLPLNQEPSYRFPLYWVGQMEKFCLLAADALLSPSQFLAHSVQQTLGSPLAIRTIPYPLPPATLSDLQALSPQPGVAGELVYVGRLELRKGVLPLLEACEQLWRAGLSFRLSMLGGDTEFVPRATTVGSYLRTRYAHRIACGQLELAGRLDHALVLERMRSAWAVLIPSLWENFPNTCIESMALGQLVLASRTGGQAEMIGADGANGLLFDWQQPGDCERVLTQALALSGEQRLVMARNAQRRISALCDPTSVLQQRIGHFEQVIAQHAPRRSFPATHLPATAPALPASPAAGEQAGLLSVVIPFYNLAAYLEETLASVLAASYQPLEVLIVNDGSTDAASLALLAAIEARDLPGVRVLHGPNQGLARARNTGAEAAQGEFIAFVDADDLVEPPFFARALDVLGRYSNVAFVYSWVRYFEGAEEIWPTFNAELPYLLGHNMLTPLVVLRRQAFLSAARNRPEIAYALEDYEGWIGLVEAGGVGVSLPEPLVRYRVRAGSMLRQSGPQQQLYLYEQIARYHTQSYQRWGNELFHLQQANGPAYLWHHPAGETLHVPNEELLWLRHEHERLLGDNTQLRDGWEAHVRYIAGQQAHIQQLEQYWGIVAADNVSLYDYRLGGKLVSRVRNSWLLRGLRRSRSLKLLLHKALGALRGKTAGPNGGR